MQKINKTILVTGANGYIGSHIIKALVNNYPELNVVALDLNNQNIDMRAMFLNIDIFSPDSCDHLFNEIGVPDMCIHLAWKDGFNHSADSHLDNLPLHYHFIKTLINSGCTNISVMGSMHEIGYYEGCVDDFTPCNPLSIYGIAKNTLRQLLCAFSVDKDISLKWLRAFYIVGNDLLNHSIFTRIVQFEKENKQIFPFTEGKNQYDFIEIEKLTEQIVKASLQSEINGVINVCSGKPVALKDKVEEFLAVNHFNIRPEYGVFPDRKYDSPAIWGSNKKIEQILKNENKKFC